jgi:hypothetical protein
MTELGTPDYLYFFDLEPAGFRVAIAVSVRPLDTHLRHSGFLADGVLDNLPDNRGWHDLANEIAFLWHGHGVTP